MTRRDLSFPHGLTLSPVGILLYMWHKVGLKSRLSRSVSNELDDIIPCLSEYLKVKQDFREGKTAEQAVIHQAERLTVEINEFITALNAHATETEREIFAKIKEDNGALNFLGAFVLQKNSKKIRKKSEKSIDKPKNKEYNIITARG